jgi:hypothetical protein
MPAQAHTFEAGETATCAAYPDLRHDAAELLR